MRGDDAFWAARIVAAFTDEMIRAVVAKARFTDPAATAYVADTLIKRRDAIKNVWLNAVNPVVNPMLGRDGGLTFENAAVVAGAATPAASYTLAWSRFDNNASTHTPVGGEVVVNEARAEAPPELQRGDDYISVAIRGTHAEHPAWAKPAQVYFREIVRWMADGRPRAAAVGFGLGRHRANTLTHPRRGT